MIKPLNLPPTEKFTAIAGRYALRLIAVFGSAVRGQTHAESDVDVAVLTAKKLTPAKRLALWGELSRLFPRDVDLSVINYIDPVVAFQIAREGIILFEAEADAWENWKSYAIRQYWDTEKFRLDLKRYVVEQAEDLRHVLAE